MIHKKAVLLLILLFVSLSMIHGFKKKKAEEDEMIKRSVLILPFYNAKEVRKYDYLSDTIIDTLETDLRKTNQFYLKRPGSVETLLKDFRLSRADLTDKKNGIRIAKRYKCDVFITGKYVIEAKRIMLFIEVVDIFADTVIASTHIEGNVGMDLFRILTEATRDVTDQMTTKLSIVSKTYFEEMMRVIKRQRFAFNTKEWTWRKKTGTGLVVGGSCLIVSFLPVLFVDMFLFYPMLLSNLNAGAPISHDQYIIDYSIFTSLLYSSTILIGLGILALIPGIPFLVYRDKKKKVTLDIRTGPVTQVALSIRL